MSRLRLRILLAPIVIALMLPMVPTSQAQNAVDQAAEGTQRQRNPVEVFQKNLAEAEAGRPLAMFLVSEAFAYGQGVEKDPKNAIVWLERAAATGDDLAERTLADWLILGDFGRQDCTQAAALLPTLVSSPSSDAIRNDDEPFFSAERSAQRHLDLLRGKALKALGGDEGIAGMAPQVQADLLEVQMLDALTKQDNQAFLDNLCASEFLGYADTLPAAARSELYYHRAVALRATGKPVAALDALNTYLNRAGRDGANYQQAIMMLRPLQAEAATK